MLAVTGGILRRDPRQHQVPRAGGGPAGVPGAPAAREWCVALTAAAACAHRIADYASRTAGEWEPGRARKSAPETSISLESVSRLSGCGP